MLSNRDYTLIIDQSSSMATTDMPNGKSRWEVAQEAALALITKYEKIASDGFTIYLFNDKSKRYDNITSSDIAKIFTENIPSGGTDLANVLEESAERYFNKKTTRKAKLNGEAICVITDGQTDVDHVVIVLNEISNSLGNNSELEISFSQIGSDSLAQEFSIRLNEKLDKSQNKLKVILTDLEGLFAEYDGDPFVININGHTRVSFPSYCIIEREVELRVQLLQDVPMLKRVFKRAINSVSHRVKNINLDVSITAPNFKIEQPHQQIDLSTIEDSEEISFKIVPLELGEQIVEIESFYDSTRVGYFITKTHVKRTKIPNKSVPIVRFMEDPITEIEHLSVLRKNIHHRILHVTWVERLGCLSYRVLSTRPEELCESKQTGINNLETIAEYLRNLNAFLVEMVSIANPSDEEWQKMYSDIQSVGTNLFQTLIPSLLKEFMGEWKSGSYVIVSTNEQWIPWELIHDGEDFWGKKFIIVRSPRINERQQLPERDRPEKRRVRQIQRVINIVGGGLSTSALQQATKLFSQIVPSLAVEVLEQKSISELEKAIRGANALHYTCHSRLQPYLLQIAGDKSPEQNLIPEMVENLPIEPGSLIFANACASSIPVLTFGKFNSFGWEFYRQGADVFIGTLGAVPVKYALSFAETVYRELFRKDVKRTIGQAITIAKEEAAKERNLFWLLYCIYGDPDFFIDNS